MVNNFRFRTIATIIKNNANILSADDELIYIHNYFDDIEKLMIEFAKLHVAEALKQAANSCELYPSEIDSVLESYPLENIK